MYAWRRWVRALWGSWTVRWGHPGLVRQSPGRERERDTDRESVCVCVCVCNSVCKSVCTSYYLRLLSILRGNQMGSIHTTVSSGGSLQPPLVIFCHQSSAIFSFLPPPVSPPPFFFRLSLPPHTPCNHLGPPECTVDVCSTLQNVFWNRSTWKLQERKKIIMCHFISLLVSMRFQVKLFSFTCMVPSKHFLLFLSSIV